MALLHSMAVAHTINGQVAKCCASRPLDLSVMAAKEEEDGVQRIPANLANLFFGNLGKCKSRATLEVDVFGEGERGEGGEG